MDYISQAHNYWNMLPPKLKMAASEEAQAMGVEVIQFLASQLRSGFIGMRGNSTSGYQSQQQGAKRSRAEAAKDKSGTLVPAQMRMGRGAELSFQQQNVLSPIKFKTGETKGASIIPAFSRERMLYKPQVVSMAFAYKMQLETPKFWNNDNELPINRFVVHNVYRHVLTSTQNTSPNSIYGKNTQSWNNTLGPDKSYVRKLGAELNGDTGTGSAYGVPNVNTGLNNTLQSPYRYPQNGEFMYTRMSRRMTENLGWNANPMKIAAIDSGPGTVTGLTPLLVYANADVSTGITMDSMPNLAPPSSTQTTQFGASYYYRSQNSRGEISYNFNNEGTNPIVVDIVITRLKKGNAMIKKDFLSSLVQVYQDGYLNYSYANRNQQDLQGQPPNAADVTTNARGPFLPAKALDNYKLTRSPLTGSYFKEQSHPYKQVARDQFIISGGATRQWSMYMQAIDYDARKYSQFQSIDLPVAFPIIDNDQECACVDDLSYCISIAISGVPAPFIEQPSASDIVTDPTNAVIDRRGTSSSCAITGLYKEHCHPVYLSMSNNETYINGKLDIPHFDESATPTLGTADILSIANATRTSDVDTALIAMGPLNTVGGG